MTERFLDEMNQDLYDEAKIRETQSTSSLLVKFYTSDLWESLKAQGYRMENHRGLCDIRDQRNNIMVEEIGIPNALYKLALVMG